MQPSLEQQGPPVVCPSHMVECEHFCVQQVCDFIRFVCSSCLKKNEKHEGHRTRKLRDVIRSTAHKISDIKMQEDLERIQVMKQSTLNYMTKLSQLFTSNVKELSLKMSLTIEEKKKAITVEYDTMVVKSAKFRQLCQNGVTSLSQIKEYANILTEYHRQEPLDAEIKIQQYNALCANFENLLKDLIDMMEEQFKSTCSRIDQKLESPLASLGGQALPDVQSWSPSLKGERILVYGSKAQRKGDNNWLRGMVLAQPSLSQVRKSSWKLKICHYTYFTIYLGMALRGVVSKNNFSFQSRGTIGHGCYMIDTHGNTFSHTDKDKNNVNQMNDFASDGRVLSIDYDPLKSMITFKLENPKSLNSKRNECSLEVPKPLSTDYFHAAIFLVGAGNSVELKK